METLRSIRDGFLGLIYPRVCVGCDRGLGESGEQWLCEACESGLGRIQEPYCSVCGQPYEGRMAHGFRCSNCSDLNIGFDFAVSGYRADGLARELIHRFKYERQHYLCALLGEWLGAALKDKRMVEMRNENWVLVPVPLHPRRQREREFNQAAELCRIFRRSHPDFEYADPLKRVRYTRRQAQLDRADRLTNLKGAFQISKRALKRETVRGRPVILVDDVLTTGATASECARVLKADGGAAMVVVITAVRG